MKGDQGNDAPYSDVSGSGGIYILHSLTTSDGVILFEVRINGNLWCSTQESSAGMQVIHVLVSWST